MRNHILRRFTRFSALTTALIALAGRSAEAQSGWPSGPVLPDGPVTVGRDWAEVVFPPLDLRRTGCPQVIDYLPQGPVRRYGWGTQTRFADATGQVDHFTTLFLLFQLPAQVPITDARLDSALAAADLRVEESRGEPPMPIAVVKPRKAWARREGRSVRIRIEGEEAVQALLKPRSDSIDIDWCRRDDTTFVGPSRTRIVRR